MIVEHHAAGQRFIEPHGQFSRRFGCVAPAQASGSVGSGAVDCDFSILHGIANAALQTALPYGRSFRAALVIGMEPCADLADLGKVGSGMSTCAEVCEIKICRLLFFGDAVVEIPQVEDALVELLPVGRRARGRQLAALLAVALRQAAERRPAVGINGVDIVAGVDFAHDRRNVVGHIGGEHAGAKQTRLFNAPQCIALGIAHGPLRMRIERLVPVEVGTHASNHAHAALFCGVAALSKEIAVTEKFAAAEVRHVGWIVGDDAGDADEDDVDLEALPVVGPLFHVQLNGVVLGHVELAHAANRLLPGFCVARCGGRVGSRRQMQQRVRPRGALKGPRWKLRAMLQGRS